MIPCIVHLLNKLRPKIRAMLKMKSMYSVPSLLNQFKTQIWSSMEYHNGALLIAGEVQLRKLDKMQRGFLYDLGLDDRSAFIEYNFAPPSLRRAIGILGFLHKRVLGTCHPALESIFPFEDNEYRYHTKTLRSFWNEVRGHRALYNNSIYMYILIYNRLPQELVDSENVTTFQGKLTQLAKMRAQRDEGISWRMSFQSCADIVSFFYASS